MELGGKPIPKCVEECLIQVRDRVRELIKQYGSLSRWGRPYFFDLKEIAAIYYVNTKLGVSLDRIAKFIGVDKTSLYKLIKKIDSEGKVSIFDSETNQTKTVEVKPIDLLNMIEEELQPKAKLHIDDPFQSVIIRNFFANKIPKRSKIAGKPSYLSDSHKKQTLAVVRKIMEWMREHGKPSNPDVWTEDMVEEALWDIYKDYRKVANAMIMLRRVPEWSQWFKGKIGAVTKRITPQMRALFYEDYIKLKKLWKEDKIDDATFLVVWLHITTGAREGYTLYSDAMDLDNPEVKSSLIGLRWENLSKVGDTYILKIYESKTEKWWTCDLAWLDAEPIETLLKYAKDKGSIIKSITGIETVGEFKKWYRKALKKLSTLLELPFELKPHDLRRSHISILAELGVPMEYAISGHMDFGVGWEDAKTALVFYLRFSKFTKEMLKRKIEEAKRIIESSTSS